MKTLTKILLVAMVCTALWPVHARAESSQAGAFRLPAYGARGWGMAGAFIVIADDESAVDWNPAGLARTPRTAGASYLQLIEGVTAGQSQLVFTMPISRERQESGTARHVAGAMLTHLGVDVAGGESYSEDYLRLAYAFTPEPLVSFGIAASGFLSSSGVQGFDGSGTSFDFTGRLSLSKSLSTALVARDVFSRYTYDDGRTHEKEPQYILGLAWYTPHLAFEGDVVRSFGDWSHVSVGAESVYFFSHVALRGGISWLSSGESRAIPAFGISARAFSNRLTLHYGAALDEEDAFGRTHRMSLAVRI